MAEGKLPLGDEHELAGRIREIIGVGPYDDVDVYIPSIGRTDGRRVYWIPEGVKQFDRLFELSREMLIDLGLQAWDGGEGWTHWLYPVEWYGAIPAGLPLLTISGREEPFKSGETAAMAREGCLAYGFVIGDREAAIAAARA